MSDCQLVSVIVPCYNGSEFLARALQSLLKQTYTNLEIIVVDDGSSDESVSIAETFRASDTRIEILRHGANRGLAAARNTGIASARGQFIAFLDCDDFWHPRKAERHIALFKEFDEVGVSYSGTQFVDRDGKPLPHKRIPYPVEPTDYHLYCRNPVTNGSNGFFRSQHLRENLFDPKLVKNQDVDCWLRIAFGTGRRVKFRLLPEVLTYYCIQPNALSADWEDHYRYCLMTWEKSRHYAPEIAGAYGTLARAFQLRAYARRMAATGNSRVALKLLFLALRTNFRIALREPLGTLLCALASCFPFAVRWVSNRPRPAPRQLPQQSLP
jgi:glycosyltransferase involved in cell wall biosynthesis